MFDSNEFTPLVVEETLVLTIDELVLFFPESKPVTFKDGGLEDYAELFGPFCRNLDL
jgi:hypothetical protein